MSDKAKHEADEAARKDAEAKAKAAADAKAKDDAEKERAAKAAKQDAKGDEPEVTVEAPYPSQADLDAIKNPRDFRRPRKVRPATASVDYKTR